MDINEAPAAEEYPLRCPPTVISLKNQSATRLALDLWRRKGSLNVDPFNCADTLSVPVPLCLRELIDSRIISIGKQLNTLFSCFRHLEITNTHDSFFRYFDSLISITEDEIIPEKCAMKCLKTNVPTLSKLKKFKIACILWSEDDIRRIWPSVFDELERNQFAVVDFFTNYWVTEMRGEQNGRIGRNFAHRVVESVTYCHNWTAFIEVVNKLRIRDQFYCITSFIQMDIPIKYLLPRLNRAQVDEILRDIPEYIISKLAPQKECFELALKIWNLVKQSITLDRFINLVNYLSYGAFICDGRGKCHEESDQVHSVLLEVWKTAPSRLMTKFDPYSIVDEMTIFAWRSGYDSDQQTGYDHLPFYVRRRRDSFLCLNDLPKLYNDSRRVRDGYSSTYSPICFGHKLDFFFKLFEDIPPEKKIEKWKYHWPSLVIRSRSDVLNRFLNLCLENENEIRRFVRRSMFNLKIIQPIVDLWLRQKLYDEVIDYSNLCTWDMNLVDYFRRRVFMQIIPSMDEVSYCDKLIKTAAEIDAHLTNVDTAKDVKRKILMSDDIEKFFMSKLKKGSTKEVIDVIDCFVGTKRSKREKQILLDLWFDFLIAGENNELDGRWEEFISWWEGSKDDWPNFKQFLNIDEIFIKLLLEAMPNLVSLLDPEEMDGFEIVPPKRNKLDEFASVDDFLMWYFVTEEKARDYKLKKIRNYEKVAALRNIFKMYNQCIIDKLLEWVFNGDHTEIDNFKIGIENARN